MSQSTAHDQTLIWALRKELATKTVQIAELKAINKNQTEEITTLRIDNVTVTREASQTEIQTKLHAIYEQKLYDAVEDEKARMHQEFLD